MCTAQYLGGGGARWVHTDRSGNRRCHDPGHLGSGVLHSLLMKGFSLHFCKSHFYCVLIPKSLLLISSIRSSFGSERTPMTRRRVDHWRSVRQIQPYYRGGQIKEETLFTNVSSFSFQPKSISVRTPLDVVASPSAPLSKERSHCPSLDGSMPGTSRCGKKIFWPACRPVSKHSSRKTQSSSSCNTSAKMHFLSCIVGLAA